ncbi:MAG: hypothetical protein ABS888_08030, partial [Eubacteriales bacterium]
CDLLQGFDLLLRQAVGGDAGRVADAGQSVCISFLSDLFSSLDPLPQIAYNIPYRRYGIST